MLMLCFSLKNFIFNHFVFDMYHVVFSYKVKADMSLVKKMIAEGADVHACDDMGQNLMHEVARYHGAEMCYFLLSCKININLGQ